MYTYHVTIGCYTVHDLLIGQAVYTATATTAEVAEAVAHDEASRQWRQYELREQPVSLRTLRIQREAEEAA